VLLIASTQVTQKILGSKAFVDNNEKNKAYIYTLDDKNIITHKNMSILSFDDLS
jgi:hypothetical protein